MSDVVMIHCNDGHFFCNKLILKFAKALNIKYVVHNITRRLKSPTDDEFEEDGDDKEFRAAHKLFF